VINQDKIHVLWGYQLMDEELTDQLRARRMPCGCCLAGWPLILGDQYGNSQRHLPGRAWLWKGVRGPWWSFVAAAAIWLMAVRATDSRGVGHAGGVCNQERGDRERVDGSGGCGHGCRRRLSSQIGSTGEQSQTADGDDPTGARRRLVSAHKRRRAGRRDWRRFVRCLLRGRVRDVPGFRDPGDECRSTSMTAHLPPAASGEAREACCRRDYLGVQPGEGVFGTRGLGIGVSAGDLGDGTADLAPAHRTLTPFGECSDSRAALLRFWL